MKTAVDEATELLEKRLGDLDEERTQLDEEHTRVENALKQLGGTSTRRRGPGRPRGSKKKDSTKPAPRRRRRGGTRADEAVKLVTKKPGISASDIAKTMKIKPNYLYRVLGDLEKEGRVKKDGRQYYPAG